MPQTALLQCPRNSRRCESAKGEQCVEEYEIFDGRDVHEKFCLIIIS